MQVSPISLLQQYFPELSSAQEKKFLALSALYQFWNEQINVVSRKDIDELYVRHVLHSLAIAKFIQFKPGTSVMDLGTGGGFPGIPLAIFFPEVHFLLVDSISKKIRVVHEIAQSLELNNVQAATSRAEQIKEQFDFVVTRAVARSAKLQAWCKGRINPRSQHILRNGIIALKGGDLSDELSEIRGRHQITPITEYFKEAFFETKKIVYFIP